MFRPGNSGQLRPRGRWLLGVAVALVAWQPLADVAGNAFKEARLSVACPASTEGLV